jgi:hypothetical protein
MQFTNTSQGGGAGAAYRWQFGDGGTSTATHPTQILRQALRSTLNTVNGQD